MRISISGLAVAKRSAVECPDRAAGAEQHGMAGCRVPLHGRAEPGVQIGLAARHQAEFDRAAGRSALGHFGAGEEAFERGIVAM